jgi:hypothetical protein
MNSHPQKRSDYEFVFIFILLAILAIVGAVWNYSVTGIYEDALLVFIFTMAFIIMSAYGSIRMGIYGGRVVILAGSAAIILIEVAIFFAIYQTFRGS